VKILHVISGLTTGGAEVLLCNLAIRLRLQGHDSVVVCLGPGGALASRLEAAGIPVHVLGHAKGPGIFPALWKLGHLARRERPDAIQGWMSHGNLAALLAAACFRSPQRPPVYWSIHQSLYTLRSESLTNAALILLCGLLSPLPRAIVYVSRMSARQHIGRGYSAEKAVVIPVGFDLQAFAPGPTAARVDTRLRLGLDPDKIWIGLVGRDDPKKDPRNFLRAAALVAARFPDARFLILGRNQDRPDNPLRAMARAEGLDGLVRFHGETAEPAMWIASLDVLVSSSYTEAFPVVVGEAMACGVPCVATNVGDVSELLGEGGLVVRPRDPGALSEAVQVLLAIGAQGRLETGLRGRERLRERFTIEVVASRYADLYQK
jgi:glycosyltransferase involved in cell wall biosynthesis